MESGHKNQERKSTIYKKRVGNKLRRELPKMVHYYLRISRLWVPTGATVGWLDLNFFERYEHTSWHAKRRGSGGQHVKA
jgi:hypothetical protein